MTFWSPKAYTLNAWQWPTNQIKPLASALVPKKVEAKVKDNIGLKLLSIRFDGTMDERNALPESLKGKLYLAGPGDVVFSKIDVRNGAIGIIPTEFDKVAFTTEFPIYQVRPEVASPQYIQLLFRSDFFQATINGMVSGASGRKRVAPEQLEAMSVPLPPLTTQQTIIAQWQTLQSQAAKAALVADQREAKGQLDFLQALGLQAPKVQLKRRAFAMRWSDMGRWGSEANRLSQQGGEITKLRFPMAQGLDCIESVSHGCSASPSALPTKLEVLKISAVTRGWLNISEKKFAPDQAKLRKQYALHNGDILLCRTNGTLDYVGRAALVEDEHPDLIFPDKVIRVRLKANVLPAYFWYLLGTPYLRAQIESFARTAVGNYAIGGKDIWKLYFPLPPLDVQQTLVTAVSQARADAARLRQQAKQLRDQAKLQIEAALLGQGLPQLGKK